jgi:hypothetical protein
MHPGLAAVTRALDDVEPWLGRDLATRRAAVSSWSVGEQLDHTLKVAAAILERLSTEGKEPGTSISSLGRLVLALGWMPRGAGKAPEFSLPAQTAASELRAALAGVRATIDALAGDEPRLRSPRRVVRHPRFGGLTAAQALRFAALHTRHHLKILRDIGGAAG